MTSKYFVLDVRQRVEKKEKEKKRHRYQKQKQKIQNNKLSFRSLRVFCGNTFVVLAVGIANN